MAVSQLGSVLYVGYSCDKTHVYITIDPSQTIPAVTKNSTWDPPYTTVTVLQVVMSGLGVVYAQGLQTPGTNVIVPAMSFSITHSDWATAIANGGTLYWNGYQYALGHELAYHTNTTVATVYSYSNAVPPVPTTPLFTLSNVYNGYDSVKLSISTTGSTSYYDIYRSNTSGGTYSKIGSITGTTTFYDNTVTTGNTYWYKVNAQNGCFDSWSTIHSIYVQSVVNNVCVIRNVATITNKTAGDTTSTYELWGSTGGSYFCVGHTYNAGTVIQDKITKYGQLYNYKIVQKTPYWSLTGASVQYTGTYSFTSAPVLTATLYSGSSRITLNWTDANIYHQYYEIFKSIDGGAFNLLATVSGVTTYNDNTVTIDHEYFYKIRDRINCFAPTYIYSSYSNTTDTIWAHPVTPASNLTASNITCTGITVTWTNNNTTLQKVTGNTIQTYYSGTWHDFATVASGATTYRLTGLLPFTVYQIRIKTASRLITSYSSSISPQTLDPAPYNLSVVVSDVFALTAHVTWTINDPPYGQWIYPQIRLSGTTVWTTLTPIAHNATGYTFTYPTITFHTKYQVRFERYGNSTYYPSPIIGFETPELPPPFCQISGFTVTNTTCGNNGTISINEPAYLDFYNFVLTDYIGNTYIFNPITAIASVPAGYYKLTASPKPEFLYYYGYDSSCVYNFIPLRATNTTIFDVNVQIRISPGSFIIAAGSANRYYAGFKDTDSGHTYNYYLIYEDGSIAFSANTTNPKGFLYNRAFIGCYYGIIYNTDNHCTYLIPINCIRCANIYNLSGVKQIFISAYNNTGNFTWDDWSTSDEDFYVQGIDPLTFVGTKIKRFYNTNPWFKLPTNQDTVYTCPFEKTRQGFMYTHTLTMNFAPSDYQRWVDLTEMLKYTNRYLIVFEDNNGNWWTIGYSNVGARVYNYKHGSEVNQYEIVFKYYGFGMLTSLAEDYVKKYILT